MSVSSSQSSIKIPSHTIASGARANSGWFPFDARMSVHTLIAKLSLSGWFTIEFFVAPETVWASRVLLTTYLNVQTNENGIWDDDVDIPAFLFGYIRVTNNHPTDSGLAKVWFIEQGRQS